MIDENDQHPEPDILRIRKLTTLFAIIFCLVMIGVELVTHSTTRGDTRWIEIVLFVISVVLALMHQDIYHYRASAEAEIQRELSRLKDELNAWRKATPRP